METPFYTNKCRLEAIHDFFKTTYESEKNLTGFYTEINDLSKELNLIKSVMQMKDENNPKSELAKMYDARIEKINKEFKKKKVPEGYMLWTFKELNQ